MKDENDIQPDLLADPEFRREFDKLVDFDDEPQPYEHMPEEDSPGDPPYEPPPVSPPPAGGGRKGPDILRTLLLVVLALLFVVVLFLGWRVLNLSDGNKRLEQTLEQTLETDSKTIDAVREELASSERKIKALEDLNLNIREKLFDERNKNIPTSMDFNLSRNSRDSLVLLFSDQRSVDAVRKADSLQREVNVLLSQNKGLREENGELARLLEKSETRLERATGRGGPDTWDVDPCGKRIEVWQSLLQNRDDEITRKDILIDSLKGHIENGITGKGYR